MSNELHKKICKRMCYTENYRDDDGDNHRICKWGKTEDALWEKGKVICNPLIGKKRSFSDAYNDCWYPDIHDKEIVWDKIPKENRIVIGVCLKCGKVEQRKSYKTRSSPSGWAVRNRDCLCGHNLTFNKDLCFREGEKIELKTELTSVVFLRCHSCNSRLDGLLYGRKWIRCGNCHEVNRIKDVESLVVWCETAL